MTQKDDSPLKYTRKYSTGLAFIQAVGAQQAHHHPPLHQSNQGYHDQLKLCYAPWLSAEHGSQTSQAKQTDTVRYWLGLTYYGVGIRAHEPLQVGRGGDTAEVDGQPHMDLKIMTDYY